MRRTEQVGRGEVDDEVMCYAPHPPKRQNEEVQAYSMTETMTPDPGKYDPSKLNDDTDSMTTLNYDVPSLNLAK